MDYTQQVEAVSRSVHKDVITLANGKPARTIILRQTLPAPAAELWDTVTKPERLAVWFAPVSGDLRINGHYTITGNASGSVTECSPSDRFFALSWEFGDTISAVRVHLKEAEDGNGDGGSSKTTTLEIMHTFPIDSHWKKYGPGAGGPSSEDWAASREAATFTERASERWRDAAIEGGEDDRWAREAGDRTTAFYVPGWEAKSTN
ncbi:hypothetical protein LLEC1_03119 [Akanthomyces lecanii]|uniref:Activator of Hsp90 ATPase homologue 1/2-like C-terminal domain-containing protein n=1 Tax=Cordyceps confragosa TaxID=2714763 RepID=A0A179I431_CORDF|nr:hypothetical protein LLEC1_03119 [Akanthomyces lecanii]